MLDSLNGAKMLTTLDLRSGYWQVPMDPKDKPKTAFATRAGQFQFTRMPFGLNSAPSTFQRMIEIVLSGLNLITCLCYLDDVIIHSKDLNQHCERLAEVLSRFRQHNLGVKISKCTFAVPKVSYLGHVISAEGISPHATKVEAVQNLSSPKSVKDVRSFLGLAGYYRRFVRGFATVAAPLTDLTKQDRRFDWTTECEQAFQTLKTLISSAPVLQYPRFDREFIVQTDASDVGVGVVLSQLDGDGVKKPVAFASQSLSPRERNYSTTEKEAYAIVYALRHFRVYLLGRQFKLVTDHKALTWLHSMEPKGCLARWVMELQEFQFSIEHRPGRRHANADALSRLVATATHTATTHAVSTQTTQTTQPESKRCLDFNAVSAVQEAPRVLTTLHLSVYYATLTEILFVLILVKVGGSAFLSKAQKIQTTAKHFLPRFLSLLGSACVPQPTVANELSAVILNPRMDLKEAQKQDPALSKLILFKSENRCRPEFSEWAGDPTLHRCWYQYDRLFLRDNILVRSVRKDSPIPRYAVVVPESLVQEVLRGIHDSPFSGHLGVTRTLDRIRERFY